MAQIAPERISQVFASYLQTACFHCDLTPSHSDFQTATQQNKSTVFSELPDGITPGKREPSHSRLGRLGSLATAASAFLSNSTGTSDFEPCAGALLNLVRKDGSLPDLAAVVFAVRITPGRVKLHPSGLAGSFMGIGLCSHVGLDARPDPYCW